MEIKGSSHTEDAQASADRIVESLREIDDIELKKMFGDTACSMAELCLES